MTTKCAVSHSELQDSFKAGKEMASKAMSKEGIKRCDFAFVFASTDHDAGELIKGVKSVTGEKTNVAGGISAGIITNDYINYEGFTAGILVIQTEDIQFQTWSVEGLEKDVYETGVKVGKAISGFEKLTNPNLFLFYDSMQRDASKNCPVHFTAPILEGIQSVIKDLPPASGVGLHTGLLMRKTEVWNNEEILQDSVVPVILSGNVKLHTIIIHGLKPGSDYYTITKIHENIIYEIDNKPALDVLEEYYGNGEESDWKTVPFYVTLGVNRGEKYGPFDEKNYVNRLVMTLDEDTRAIHVIDVDLRDGDEFQFMRRHTDTNVVREGALELLNSLDGREPLFAFYISCLAMIQKMFGSDKEEAEEIQEAIGNNIPLIGFYSGVEIADVKGKLMPLDWTGVLCIFSRD
ncbi:MAG: FIST signal transduction protein [Bacteroidales bacterium]